MSGKEDQSWTVSWAASAQGPYPYGAPVAQPDMRFAIPDPEAGFRNQSLRMLVAPDLWGKEARLRFSNVFGDRVLKISRVFTGLHMAGGAVVPDTSRPVLFSGQERIEIPPKEWAWSDPVPLPWVSDPEATMLLGRRLTVSFDVEGESGPPTWHAKAMATNYISMPGQSGVSAEESETHFPFSTASWFFLDAVEMCGTGARAIVAFGDSITDGTGSTINGDDRWPDVLSRRLKRRYGNACFSVVNAGIGGNMVAGPAGVLAEPLPGGQPARLRIERDVLSLSGISTIIWMEGINDYANAVKHEAVAEAIRETVELVRSRLPSVRLVAGTLTPALNSPIGISGSVSVDENRRRHNDFIRRCGLFDHVIEFEGVALDAGSGELRAEFQPSSSIGGPGDKLHLNRAGFLAMAEAIDLDALTGHRS